MRKYEVIWNKIKQAEEGQWVIVTVQEVHMIQTIINMVQLEKSAAHTARKGLDIPAYGKLEIKRLPETLQVHFRLKNSGANL